jgi:site-specific recombinase XerD
MDNAHKADPNSNREWFQEEWSFAREKAPLEVLIPMMLARHCGLRGQTIVKVNRKQIVDHDMTGQAIRYYARKNRKIVTLPMMQEL